MNDALERAAACAGLELAVQKTEMDVLTRPRGNSPVIRIRGQQLTLGNKMKYLEIEINRGLTFKPHVQEARDKALRVINNLAHIMPNVGGPKEPRRCASERKGAVGPHVRLTRLWTRSVP